MRGAPLEPAKAAKVFDGGGREAAGLGDGAKRTKPFDRHALEHGGQGVVTSVTVGLLLVQSPVKTTR